MPAIASNPFSSWHIEPLNRGLPGIIEVAARREAAQRVMRAFVGTGAGPKVIIDADGHEYNPRVHSTGDRSRFFQRTPAQWTLFQRVTEGRHVGNNKFYTCGELVGLVYSLLGCRDEGIVNRDDDDLDGIADGKQPPAEDRGQRPWKVGWNLTLLKSGAQKAGCWVNAADGILAAQGDAFMCGEDGGEHVGLWEADPEPTGRPDEWCAPTIEAGQLDSGGQCTKRFLTFLRRESNRIIVSRTRGGAGRPYVGHVDLAGLPLVAPARLPPVAVVG